MSENAALLVLSDGSVFQGVSIGASGERIGELVFNTSMTGYQEMLTDPSYAKQIVMLTTAHVGNTGCNLDDNESNRVFAQGLVIRENSPIISNYRANTSLTDWLKKNDVVAISGIDTRHLTQLLRDKGALNACLTTDVDNLNKAKASLKAFSGLDGLDLAKEVSRQTIERWYLGRETWGAGSKPASFHVVAYDFGVKHNILKILHDKGCHITLVPAKTSAEEALSLNPDGIFLSNGPGDPAACTYAIDAVKVFLARGMPLFGICLGYQIMGIALGARSFKMKFGHHGANHPVSDVSTARVMITSQNHGFAIDESSLPKEVTVTHRSLFDGTLQGFRHETKPLIAFQGHPEASPGPHDSEGIFDNFIKMMQQKEDNA